MLPLSQCQKKNILQSQAVPRKQNVVRHASEQYHTNTYKNSPTKLFVYTSDTVNRPRRVVASSHTLSMLLATYSTPGPALLDAFWRSSFLLLSNCSFIMASRCCSGFIV